MRRPALTLVETLVALSLLSAMMVITVGWVTSTQSTLASTSSETRWRSAAAATVQLIADDLRQKPVRVDFRDAPDSISFEGDTLRVSTRDGGSCIAVYTFDRDAAQLSRSVERRGQLSEPRLLIGDIASFTAVIDDDAPADQAPSDLATTASMRVELRSQEGRVISRSLSWSRGDRPSRRGSR